MSARAEVRDMLKGLRWLLPMLLAACSGAVTEPLPPPAPPPETGPSLQRILEVEQTARLLASLLIAGRHVINENQDLIDDSDKESKGFTPAVFERQLVEVFRTHSGVDLRDLNAARVPPESKELLRILVAVSKEVVADAQPAINRKGVPYKGFIPAVFGSRVALRFTEATGIRLKQTALAPRNPANVPDAFERRSLHEFSDPNYQQSKVISEITANSHSLRLMIPLYTTRRCLDCHGEPKGEPDKTGYPREGLKLGQNAGAISVLIPMDK